MANKKFDYDFIQDPDDALKCSKCLEVAKGQPMQHGGSCGKLFCREWIENNEENPCPVCRGRNPQYFKDAKSLREIKCLGVRCDNVDRGCEWTGTVGTLGYTLVECTNKCSIKQKTFCLMRKDLDNHVMSECPLRAHKCTFCGEKGTYHSITGEHDLHCLKKPIPCPNTDCTLTVERGGVEEHVASECEHTIVACKYSNIGCTEQKKRRDIKIHEKDTEVHLDMSLNAVSQLNNKVVQLSNTIVQLSSSVAELNCTVTQFKVVIKELANIQNSKSSVFIKIHNFIEKKKANEMFSSEPFFTIPNGYKMQLLVYCNGYGDAEGKLLSVYAMLLDVPYKDQLKWPFRGNVAVELLNQRDHKNLKRILEYSDDDQCARPGANWSCPYFIDLSLLVDIASHAQLNACHMILKGFIPGYLKDNILLFKVTVEEA